MVAMETILALCVAFLFLVLVLLLLLRHGPLAREYGTYVDIATALRHRGWRLVPNSATVFVRNNRIGIVQRTPKGGYRFLTQGSEE
jgi:hypothetical protein